MGHAAARCRSRAVRVHGHVQQRHLRPHAQAHRWLGGVAALESDGCCREKIPAEAAMARLEDVCGIHESNQGFASAAAAVHSAAALEAIGLACAEVMCAVFVSQTF